MRKTGFQLVAVIATVLIVASPAPAFYWTLRSVPNLVNPIPPIPGADPLPIPPDTPVPGGGPEDPNPAPEPTTAVACAIGLAVLGARRLYPRLNARKGFTSSLLSPLRHSRSSTR
jgi:hypothetical protein